VITCWLIDVADIGHFRRCNPRVIANRQSPHLTDSSPIFWDISLRSNRNEIETHCWPTNTHMCTHANSHTRDVLPFALAISNNNNYNKII